MTKPTLLALAVAIAACVAPIEPVRNVCNGAPTPPAFRIVYSAHPPQLDTTAVLSNRWQSPARSADTIRFNDGKVTGFAVLGWSTFNPDRCRSLSDSLWSVLPNAAERIRLP